MSIGFDILSPAGAEPAGGQALAPRVRSLQGISLGLLDNGKHNAGPLLAAIGALLRETYGLELMPHPKVERNVPLTPQTLSTLRQCSAVINGVPD
ncbi:MAG: hypothetical protein IT307_11920 [Chloroflexi bacterium]|nr:hypothetical protein [Chloroflexota bacterium]